MNRSSFALPSGVTIHASVVEPLVLMVQTNLNVVRTVSRFVSTVVTRESVLIRVNESIDRNRFSCKVNNYTTLSAASLSCCVCELVPYLVVSCSQTNVHLFIVS